MGTKQCGKCGAEKPATEFHRCAKAKDWLFANCKDCSRAYQRARRADPTIRQRYAAHNTARYHSDPVFRERRKAWSRERHVARASLCLSAS